MEWIYHYNAVYIFSCQWIGLLAALCFHFVLSCSHHSPEAHVKQSLDGTAGSGICDYLAFKILPQCFTFTKWLYHFFAHQNTLSNIYLIELLVFASFKGVQCYFIVVLISISLTTNEDTHLWICFLVIHVFSFVRCLFMSSACFF